MDARPDRPGVGPDGCPVLDPDDRCPDVPGFEPDGCPPLDRDGDGFLDEVDACPERPGVEPDGCPLVDTDRDGLLDPDDACVTEPETRNGFEDADGCPDELPEELERFTGVLRGIYFELDEAIIRPRSRPVLDRAVTVLQTFARMINPAELLGGTFIEVTDTSFDYPGGTRVGFVVQSVDSLLIANLLPTLVLTTVLDGQPQQSGGSEGPLDLDALLLPDAEGKVLVTIETTGDYDGIRLDFGGLLGAVDELEVYAACFEPQ